MSKPPSITDQALGTLMALPLEPGTLITIKQLEELFGSPNDSQSFQWLVSGLRHRLYDYGIYLSGEGVSQTGAYEILHPRDNAWIAKLSLARVERDLEGKQRLLLNTNLSTLSDLEKRRHESTLRELSFKFRALQVAEERGAQRAKSKKELSQPSAAKPSQAEPSTA